MANALYPLWKQALMTGEADAPLDDENVVVYLIDTADYTYNATHENLDDVAEAALVAVTGALQTKSYTDGVFDADNITFSSVTGDVCEALLIVRATGTTATSRLVCYLDTSITGMPVTPNGGDIGIQWDDAGIFGL